MKKKLFTPNVSSETKEEGSTATETVHVDSPCQMSEMDQIKRIQELEMQLLQAQQDLTSLRLGNTELKRKLAESASQQEEISSRFLFFTRSL